MENTHTQTKQANGYVCFYRGKRKDVEASTSYEAQQIAARLFQAKKSYDVNVMLARKGGENVIHAPNF